MPELDDLTLAFLAAHPPEAASELERLPAPRCAALLAGAPARVVAPVLAAMRRRTAADALMALDSDGAARVLGALWATAAAGILRHVPAARRAPMLDALPSATALTCRGLLRYPDDAVGAFTQTQILILGEQATAAEALDALRAQPDVFDAVFVVTSGQQLLGRATAASLLRAPPALRLSALAQPIARLPALMPVASAIEEPGFAQEPLAAVLEHGDRLLGSVTLAALRRAQTTRSSAPDVAGETAVGWLAYAYWSSVVGLAEAAVGMLMASRRPQR
jgi:Mg/Co/Ni transporter MgtE